MRKSDFERMAGGREPLACLEQCMSMCRAYHRRAEKAQTGFIGADRAEAEGWHMLGDAFALLGRGADPEAVRSYILERWKAHAKTIREFVQNAPRISHGPRAGQSVYDHMWVSDEWIESHLEHVFGMVRIYETKR